MEMYKQLAQYYEEIFPLSTSQLNFVLSSLESLRDSKDTGSGSHRLLEVGCGVGDAAAALVEKGAEVDGIDLNPAMIRRARERHGENDNPLLRFYEMDMREVTRHFSPGAFHLLTCLGNTLVHLQGPEEIEGFIRSAATLLKSEGMLIVQILNYDHLLEKRPESLPPIETDNVRFERRYSYSAERGSSGGYSACGSLGRRPGITFSTRLLVKESGEEYEDSVELYPLRKSELREMLLRVGFQEPRLYGDFDGSPLEAESFPLIAVSRPA